MDEEEEKIDEEELGDPMDLPPEGLDLDDPDDRFT